MQAISVTRVLVWSRWLRLSHWLMAFSCIGLIASGWLMRTDTLSLKEAQDIHFILSGLLIPAILLRLLLLFLSRGTDHISDCEPNLHRIKQAGEVLRFYLTLGKAPLPRWFSHNPLWGPVYLMLFVVLVMASWSGVLLLQDIPFFLGISYHDLHQISYYAIAIFTLLHLPAVFSHDLSNKNCDISGMVNGYKIFNSEKIDPTGKQQTYTVALDDLIKTKDRSTPNH